MMRIDSWPAVIDAFNITELETPRLWLRRPEATYAVVEDMLALYSDPECARYNAWIPVEEHNIMRLRLEGWVDDWDAGRKFKWLIFEKQLDRYIGDITLVRFDMRWREVEIGFNLVRAFWRMGYMSEALEAVLEYAFTKLKLDRVSMHVHHENKASLALLNKFRPLDIGMFRLRDDGTNDRQYIKLLHIAKSGWIKDRIKFREYSPELRPHFERISRPWLTEFGYMNDDEEAQLKDPVNTVLKNGGQIYFIEFKGLIVGTACLRHKSDAMVELVKFGVDANYRGHGFGYYLMEHLVEMAREENYEVLELYSHPELERALHLYNVFGFRDAPIPDDDPYHGKCEIRMELRL